MSRRSRSRSRDRGGSSRRRSRSRSRERKRSHSSKTEFAGSKVENFATFEEMGLKAELLRGMYGAGFEKPSFIQQRAIMPVLQRRDLIAQAQSGTGKSSLIAIVALQLADVKRREVQVLVLSPTREIAAQAETSMALIGSHLSVQVHWYLLLACSFCFGFQKKKKKKLHWRKVGW
jgi:ATP-dependent RNA helicase